MTNKPKPEPDDTDTKDGMSTEELGKQFGKVFQPAEPEEDPKPEPLGALRLTQKELDDLLEYSCSLPTGTTIGKRWKCNTTAYRYNPLMKPHWIVGEYTEHENPEKVGIVWRDVDIVNGTEPLGAKKRVGEFLWKNKPDENMKYLSEMEATRLVKEAEAALREKMECEHPKACWVQPEPIQVNSRGCTTREMAIDAGDPSLAGEPYGEDEWEEQEPYCSACVAQAQAVKEAALKAQLAEREDVLNKWPPCPAYYGEKYVHTWICEREHDQVDRIKKLRRELEIFLKGK